MKTPEHYNIGTLINDMGKIGIIYRTIESGTLQTQYALIDWRFNYEIYYFDGGITVMAHNTLKRLMESGVIEIIKTGQFDCIIEEDIETPNDL